MGKDKEQGMGWEWDKLVERRQGVLVNYASE